MPTVPSGYQSICNKLRSRLSFATQADARRNRSNRPTDVTSTTKTTSTSRVSQTKLPSFGYLFIPKSVCVWIVDCGEEGTVSVHQIRSAFIVYKQTGARVDGCTISIVSSSPFSYTQFALIAIIFY